MKRDSILNSDDNVLSDVRYYTYSEVAKILRCSERTVHNRVRNGELIPFRNGRLVLFTKECIDDFLKRDQNASENSRRNCFV